MSKNKSGGGGVSLAGVVQIVFLILKLVGVISWPWIWVLSPLWISVLLTLLVLVIVAIMN